MKNEFCHDKMKCQKNCPCADKDGIETVKSFV